MEYKISGDAFEPLDNADPRVVAQGKAELEERAARKERERGRKGASMGEGKKGGKKKPRQRDKERSAEFKRRKEAEAAGEEYIAPKREHTEKGPRKPTLAERQAAAEEAFNAMFDMPNVPGKHPKKSKAKGKGDNGYSYAAFEKGKKHRGSHDGYERDYDEEPRSRKGKRSYDRDNNFGGRDDRFSGEERYDRKPRGKKYSDKQYSDGRGSKPGKKYNKPGKHGASFEGRGSSDGYQRSGKGRGSSDGFQRSGKGGHGKQGGSFSKGGKGSFDKGRKGNGGRGKSEFRPGRGGRSGFSGKGGKR